MEILIEELRKLCTDDTMVLTNHVANRCHQRNITVEDITQTILQGEIIEQYPNDYPHPSCLVFGLPEPSRFLHVVCGIGGGYLWIITAYYPNTDKFEADLKTRKVERK